MNCTNCGIPIAETWKHCAGCGAELPPVAIVRTSGAEAANGAGTPTDQIAGVGDSTSTTDVEHSTAPTDKDPPSLGSELESPNEPDTPATTGSKIVANVRTVAVACVSLLLAAVGITLAQMAMGTDDASRRAKRSEAMSRRFIRPEPTPATGRVLSTPSELRAARDPAAIARFDACIAEWQAAGGDPEDLESIVRRHGFTVSSMRGHFERMRLDALDR